MKYSKTEITEAHMAALGKLMSLCGSQKKVSDTLNTSISHVNHWYSKRKPIPLVQAVKAEKIFKNQITIEELRPDLFLKEKP